MKTTTRANLTNFATMVMTSVVVTCFTWGALQWLPLPWKMRILFAQHITLGGGPGEGSITLAAGPMMGGAATATFKGAQSASTLELWVASKGNPMITMNSGVGHPELTLMVEPDGQPHIRIMDPATGKVGWSVTLDA